MTETIVTKDHLAKIMRKVQGLLAQADSTTFEEEAKTFRAHAEKLMREYRIAEENLIATDQVEILPEWVTIEVPTTISKLINPYAYIAYAVADHAGVQIHATSQYDKETMRRKLVIHAVGYAGDLRQFEWIFSAARIAFAEALEPQVNPELSDQLNAYRLRSAGVERNRIAYLLWGSAMDDGHAHGKVAKLYKAECAARNEDPKVVGRGLNVETYRKAYADGFEIQLRRRLRDARDAADSTGGALVLAGRKERIREAFYTRFPEMRPSTDVATREEPCARCAKSKSKSGKCPDHRPYAPTAADRRRWERESFSTTALAGRGAGQDAANAVEISRTTERAVRVETGPQGRGEQIAREILGC
jgi:hypothetical protein